MDTIPSELASLQKLDMLWLGKHVSYDSARKISHIKAVLLLRFKICVQNTHNDLFSIFCVILL